MSDYVIHYTYSNYPDEYELYINNIFQLSDYTNPDPSLPVKEVRTKWQGIKNRVSYVIHSVLHI